MKAATFFYSVGGPQYAGLWFFCIHY